MDETVPEPSEYTKNRKQILFMGGTIFGGMPATVGEVSSATAALRVTHGYYGETNPIGSVYVLVSLALLGFGLLMAFDFEGVAKTKYGFMVGTPILFLTGACITLFFL